MSDTKKLYDKTARGWLTYLDIFGVSFKFLIKGNETEKTYTGAIITIFYVLITLALFFGFGIDLYQRKNPKVSFNTESGNYQLNEMSNSNFTLAYRIEDENGEQFLDDSIISIKLFYISYEVTNGQWGNMVEKIIPNKRCHELKNYKEKEDYYNISLLNWFCIDFDNTTWGGNWDGNFIKFFQINFEQCINTTQNNSSCASQTSIIKSMYNPRSGANLYASQLAMNVQAATNNYEEPLRSSLVNTYQNLNTKVTKSKVQTFKKSMIKTDVGWFYSHFSEESIFGSDSVELDFTFKEEWTESVLLNAAYFLGRTIDTYDRSYTKIQEVLASVGGFSKIFYTLILIIYTYVEKANRYLILTYCISFDEDTSSISSNLEKFNIRIGHMKIKNPIKIKSKTVFAKKQKKYISFLDLFCHSKCKIKSNNKYINNTLNYFLYYQNYFEKKLDIVSYLNLIHQLKIMKKILLSEENRIIVKNILPTVKISNSKENNKELIANTSKKDSQLYEDSPHKRFNNSPVKQINNFIK